MTSHPVARNALVVGLGNIGSRVLGLVREQAIAALFGATAGTDAFRVAFRVPLAFYDLLVGGMVSSALVPVFSRYLSRDDPELATVAGSLLNLILLALALLVAAGTLLALPLMRVMANGYPDTVQALSAELLRVLLPALLFMGASAVCTALLYAQERFALPALAVSAFNTGIIAAALLLHGVLGIAGLAAGVVAGAVLQFVLQAPVLRRLGYRLVLALRHAGVREVLRLYFPVALGLLVSTAGVFVDTVLASRTGEGNLAAMGFATTLVQFPLGLVASGVSSAVLPVLARCADDKAVSDDYRATLALGLRLVLLTILPAATGLVLLRVPIIQILFQRGAFDAAATERTALAFLAYAPGLPAAALDQILIQGFYARRRTVAPVLVGVASVGVYLATALLLVEPLGMPGLALANSAQWVSHLLIMAVLTRRATGGLHTFGVARTAGAGMGASAFMSMLLLGSGALLPAGPGAAGLALVTAARIGMAAVAYLGALWLFAREDLLLLKGALRRGQHAA